MASMNPSVKEGVRELCAFCVAAVKITSEANEQGQL